MTGPARHRATAVRPRYGRLAAAGASLVVTAVALLGGVGVFGTGDSRAAGSGAADVSPVAHAHVLAAPKAASTATSGASPGASAGVTPSATPTGSPTASPSAAASTAVPADSGHGKRIVFSQTGQRVWLIGADDRVERTYLVSGSVSHNLHPGTYHVYSRSRWAVGIDDSGVMQYFVRFTQGPSGAAIGFHTIPTHLGHPLQTAAQLGTPQSHGCIRQATPNAIALWDFAPVGTEVDVVKA